jgi:hypothetical protein
LQAQWHVIGVDSGKAAANSFGEIGCGARLPRAADEVVGICFESGGHPCDVLSACQIFIGLPPIACHEEGDRVRLPPQQEPGGCLSYDEAGA